MSSFSVDVSEVIALAKNLGKTSEEIYAEVDAVSSKGALNIKNEMIADARSSVHFKGMASSITYEHSNSKSVIRREIGPDKGRRGGALGNIYYFGTSRGGGSGDLEKPLRTEGPRFEKALADLADKFGSRL